MAMRMSDARGRRVTSLSRLMARKWASVPRVDNVYSNGSGTGGRPRPRFSLATAATIGRTPGRGSSAIAVTIVKAHETKSIKFGD